MQYSHLNTAEPGRRRTMRHVCHLHRFSFATIVDTPHVVQLRTSDAVTGPPELIRDAGVRRVLDHVLEFPSLDLPADLAAELEVQAPIIDGPALDAVHVKTILHAADQLLEGQVARFEVDTHHADNRAACEAIGPHRPHGFLADDGS